MLLSGPHLSLLFYLRTYLQVGPEVQESDAPGATISTDGEGYREYILQGENTEAPSILMVLQNFPRSVELCYSVGTRTLTHL